MTQPLRADSRTRQARRENQHKNRHERRRQQALRCLREASRVKQIRIFGRADAKTNPWLLKCIEKWLSEAKHRGPPICVCRNHELSLQPGSMPSHFVTVLPYGITEPKHMLMCGLCEPCMAHPDRQDRLDAKLRRMWPDLRRLNHPVQAPERVQ